MIFNKKEFAEKFGLSTLQLANEFARVCSSCKYEYEYSDGYKEKYTKYYFQDYTEEYVFARDCENRYEVALTYTFSGDIPVVDFESAKRTKVTRELMDMGDSEINDEDEIEEMEFSIESLEKAKIKLEKEIEEFKAIVPIEDKTELVTELEGKVSAFELEIEGKNQVILDLGVELQGVKSDFEAKEIIITELEGKLEVYTTKENDELAEIVKEEFKTKANDLYSKFMHGLSVEEMESFKEKVEITIDEDSFKGFKSEIEQLALSKFEQLSKVEGNKNFSAKSGRIPVEENIARMNKVEEVESKSVFDKWKKKESKSN